jgi:hypothetical protein
MFQLLFLANYHKIAQILKILTFDLKTVQKVQNKKDRIKNSFHKTFIPFALSDSFYKLGLMKY